MDVTERREWRPTRGCARGLPDRHQLMARRVIELMIGLGIFLLILAVLFPELAVLWWVGIIALIVGIILAVLGTMGRAVGGRRHYY